MIYHARTLFPGTAIEKDPELHLVGVPDNKSYSKVSFGGFTMTLKDKKCLGVRTFEDKFGRDKQYRLFYYEWRPDPIEPETDYTDEGLAKLHSAMSKFFKKKYDR